MTDPDEPGDELEDELPPGVFARMSVTWPPAKRAAKPKVSPPGEVADVPVLLSPAAEAKLRAWEAEPEGELDSKA